MRAYYYIAFVFAIVVVLAKGTIGSAGCLRVELIGKPQKNYANFSSRGKNGSWNVSRQPGFKLECSCDNQVLNQKIQWYGPDEMIVLSNAIFKSQMQTNTSSTLILRRAINCRRAGVYTCKSNNGEFEVPYLIFPEKDTCSPKLIEIKNWSENNVTGNSSVVLKCGQSQKNGIDPLQYLWMVNGENQTNNTDQLQVSVTQNTAVTCTVSNTFGSTSVSINITVQDMPVAPPLQPLNLTISYANSTSITLTWKYLVSDHKMYNQPNISSFTIVYDEKEVETNSADETYTLHGLNSSTSYIICVVAGNSGTKGERSDWIVANTTGKIEDPTRILTARAISAMRIEITRKGNTGNEMYQCWINDTQNTNTTILEMSGLFVDLLPDTIYAIDCVEVDSKGKYLCKEYNHSVLTKPGKVKELTFNGLGQVKGDKIHQNISWKRPDSHISKLDYIVALSYKKESRVRPVNVTASTNFLELELKKSKLPIIYIVKVAAMSSAGIGEYSEDKKLQYKEPGQPRNVTVTAPSCNTITVVWSAPNDSGGLPITGYTVKSRASSSNNERTENHTTLSASIGNVIPGIQYTVSVAAINLEPGQFSDDESITMPIRDNTSSIKVNRTSHTTLLLSSTSTVADYKCSVSNNMEYDLLSENSTEVLSLEYDTVYSVDCVEMEDGYAQCTEYNTTILTAPGKVQTVMTTGLGIVMENIIHQRISWERPKNHLSQLIYTVKYVMIKRNNQANNMATHNTTSTGTTTTLMLPKRPQPPLTYNVWVAAVSAAGEGPYSKKADVTYTAPDPPTGLMIGEHSCNSLLLSWTPPGLTGGLPITKYNIKLLENSKPTMPEADNMTSATIENLHPNTMYKIKVSAQNSLGPGMFSEEKQQTTMQRNSTTSIRVQATSTSIQLTRIKGDEQYKCFLNNTQNKAVRLTTSNTATVPNLLADTIYSISCIEVDMKDNYQCVEYNTTVQTGLPEVMNLQHQEITVYNSTYIHQPLTWWSLPSTQQAVANYNIRYSQSAQECSLQDGAFEEVTSTTNRQTLELPVPMSETQYTVCVAAVGNETGTGVYSKLQITYAEPDAPLLRAIDVQSCKNVIVAWDAPQDKGGLPIQGYQLHYYSDPTQEPVVLNISGNTTEKELDNLLPGTEYTFVIKATTSIATDNNNTLSNTTRFRGLADEILIATQDKSRMINITSKNGTLFICWINKTKDQYENYTVNKITTVEGLQPDTLYSIDCVEINSKGEYQCRELDTTVLTGLPPPTNITTGSVSLNRGNTKVLQTIQWDLLKSGHQMVEQYTVKYGIDSEIEKATEADVKIVMNEQNKVAIKFLIPQEPITYFVWVAGNGSETGVGEYSKALQITYTAPNQPSKINTANLTCNAIQLTWEQPDNTGGLPIQGYHVSYSTATGNDSTYTTKTSIEWLDRLPNTLYDVCIRANNYILNQTCEPYSITTSPRNKTTDEEVSLNFIPPGRLKFVKRITTTNRFTCWVVGENNITSYNLKSTASQNIVGPLQTDSQYTLSCVEIDGMEKYQCKEFNRTTSIGVPKVTLPPEQRQAEELNETHFKQHITWQNVPPSSDRNMTNYTMLIRTDDTNQVTETNRTVHTNFEELSLPIPTSPITYYIQVAAVGSKTGQGEYSDNFTRTYTYPEPPDDLTVGNMSISCNTYSIKWTEMVTSGELPVTNYKVTVTNANNAVIYNETISPKANNMSEHQLDLDNYYNKSKLFQDLLPDMTYTVHVTTTNLLGESMDNKTVTATTTPKENLSIEMQPFSSTGAHLLIWPQYNNTVNYSCSLTALQAENYTVSTIELNNTLSKLSPNTTYSVWCLVYEEDRERELCYEGRAEGRTFPLKNLGEAKSDVLIIGLVVAVPLALVLCIIGIIVMIIIIARCKRTSKGSYEIREPEVIDLPQIVAAVMDDKLIAYRNIQRKDDISKRNFSEHVRNLHSNKDSRFKSEFEKITKEPAVSNTIAQENRTKNRYVNIFGYDYCRVILNNPDGGDYVNAAYIDGYKKPQKYIATQGPTPSTTMDFWEMIWEQKASVLVMLTRLVEGTKTKCEKYWNEEIDGQYQPGRNLNITTKSYRVMPGFEVRYFEVQKMGDEFGKSSPLKVKQFLYTAWPDHGVPQYSSSMVKFIMEQIRPEVQNSSAPIIVHCSAGAGRTGTLIAIDTTIDRLEEEGDINIFECVELMRARRTQMVQTSSQYIYIHDAINDFVTCGDTAIAAHELGPRTMGLHQVEFGGLHTAFEEQFYTLEGTSPELCKADHDFAELPKVKPRNRYSGLHTYSDNFIETEDEENYVNATEIPGYYGQNHFIAAQAPMKNTVEDTWNVIREQDCKVVVVLTNFNEDGQEMCAPFWPTEAGVSMEVGFMKINLVHTLNYERYNVSEVSVTVQDSDIVTTAKVHHYKAWKKNGRPDVPSLLRLMGDVQRSHQGKKNPLLVMCDDGMSRTGVFITVMSEIDRVKVEGEVDIFHTVKAARKARPHMVSTVFDYELCHEILLNYLESFDTYANFKI